jgi:tRNA threonylcarbamoyladenosine biosynthesis protein TsaE
MKHIHVTQSERETRDIAKEFLQLLNGGEVVGLRGELGAGKTAFVKGVADGVAIERPVRSPSYTLVNVYEVTFPVIDRLVHVDLYRLEDGASVETLGFEQWMGDEGVVMFIEWPERADVETDYLINIEYGDTPDERRITISG